MKKRFLLLLITIIVLLSTFAKGQVYINPDKYHSANIRTDSIFEKFVTPQLPECLFGTSGDYKDFNASTFLILCSIVPDTAMYHTKVKNIYTYPIYNCGNTVPIGSPIWDTILTNLKLVSKDWILKTYFFTIDSTTNKEYKQMYIDANECKTKYIFHPLQWLGNRLMQSPNISFILELPLNWRDTGSPSLFYYFICSQ